MIWFNTKAPSSNWRYQVDVSVDKPDGHVQLRSVGANSPNSWSCSYRSVTGKKFVFVTSLAFCDPPFSADALEDPVLISCQLQHHSVCVFFLSTTYSQLPQPDMVVERDIRACCVFHSDDTRAKFQNSAGATRRAHSPWAMRASTFDFTNQLGTLREPRRKNLAVLHIGFLNL